MYAYKNNQDMTQSQADKFARQITGGKNETGFVDSVGAPIPASDFSHLEEVLKEGDPLFSRFQYTDSKGMLVDHTIVIKGAIKGPITKNEYVIFNHRGDTYIRTYDNFKKGTYLNKSNAKLCDYLKPKY